MSKDHYQTLGISKSATEEEIKKAFRKLAQEHHPDKPSGNEAKFKEINEAYSVLSNKEKRAQYDRFGSSFSNGGGGQGAGGFSSQGFDFSGFTQGAGGSYEFDIGDIFGSIFGGGMNRMRRGKDIVMDTRLSFKESIQGVNKKITIQRDNGSKEELDIRIPAGIDNGETVRLKGKGEPIQDGQAGDLYLRVHVDAHKTLRKQGHHLITDITISISDSILGSKKEIETLDGKLSIKIPKGIHHGEVLRVRNKGVQLSSSVAGDLLVRISVNVPTHLSSKAKKALETLREEGL